MKFSVVKLDPENEQHLNAIVKWHNDESLYHLVVPVRDQHTPKVYETVASLKKNYAEHPEYINGKFMLYEGMHPIGNFSLQIDPAHLLKKIKGTSWLGITIGEKEYWGTGAALYAMNFFEEESKRLGACRIELGTFEFNHRARQFYQKLGYVEFGRLKDFTFWNDRFWDDIRMEKGLI
jgi:RimJ/RimL family protein N-acetyltransferase